MTWKPPEPKWDWRKFLTREEAIEIEYTDRKIDQAKSLMLDVKRSDRSLIMNRAIARARYAIRKLRP